MYEKFQRWVARMTLRFTQSNLRRMREYEREHRTCGDPGEAAKVRPLITKLEEQAKQLEGLC